MLAGAADVVASVQPLLAPPCVGKLSTVRATPNALIMKFAMNLFMICMVTGLAEAMHFARSYDVDLGTLVTVLDASPMASDVSRVKAAKLAACDLRRGGGWNASENTTLIANHHRWRHLLVLDICHTLYAETDALGEKGFDMVAVISDQADSGGCSMMWDSFCSAYPFPPSLDWVG